MGHSPYQNEQQAKAPPPNKYELPEEDPKTGLLKRFSVGLLLSSVFVLLKEVLFGATARADSVTNNDPGNGNIEPPSLVLVETPEPINQAALEDKPSPSHHRASSPSTSIDSFFTNEQPITVEPVQFRLSAGHPLAPANDNEPAGPAVGSIANDLPPQVGSATAGSGKSNDRGGFDDRPNVDDDTATDPRPTSNRAPVVAGPARLKNLLVNQTVIIATASLLQNVADADGDVLSIQNLVASSGNLVEMGPDTWSFTPDLNDTTEVTFTYNVTDGIELTPQIAFLDLLPLPGKTFVGTDASDTIIGTPSNDIINAHGGDDAVYAREGNDTVYGGDGDDRILAGEGDDVIFGGAGDDTIFGGDGDDVILGGDGDDTMFGGDGNDVILGENGQDQIIATISDGNDFYFGGAGTDTYDLSVTEADATVDLAAGTASSSQTGSDSLSDIENVTGGAGDDLIIGSDGNNVIQGGAGADAIDGGAGDDRFIATISDGNDSYFGGAGTDTYDLSGTEADATVDLASRTANSSQTGSDSLSDIDNVTGGAGDDLIVGSDGNNVIQGGAGADAIDGGAGDDRFIATISDGNDSYFGGAGTDTYDLSGTQAGVVVDLKAGTAEGAEIGHDTLSGIENVVGGAGDDIFKANEFINVFTAGEGDDTFEFSGIFDSTSATAVRNTIMDFHVGDKIDLSGIDANWMLADNQDFELVVDKLEFSDAGQIKFRFESFADNNERTVIEGNIDLDGEFEFEIELQGHHELTKADFIGVS